jgi:ribonuclease J
MGRAMERVIAVARECGYLEGLPPFLGMDNYDRIPRNKVLALATGSQGEPRAAMARIAEDEHPAASLAPGDMAIFSSRAIPGNEKAVGKIINGLVGQGIEVVTDRTNLVHVSGHPRRAELAQMYAWTRPKIAVPAHGEALHLSEHAAFAKGLGVSEVVKARNGEIVLLAAGEAGVVDEIAHGRLYKDGSIVLETGDDCVAQRRRLSFAGLVSIAIAISAKGDLAGDPDVMIAGLPKNTRDGAGMDELIDTAIFETFDNMPRPKRRDADVVSGAVERAVRNAVNGAWGKKPSVHVLVVEV